MYINLLQFGSHLPISPPRCSPITTTFLQSPFGTPPFVIHPDDPDQSRIQESLRTQSLRGALAHFQRCFLTPLPPGSFESLDTMPPGSSSLYGNKASLLAFLRQRGFPVPPAIVLSSELVEKIMEQKNIAEGVSYDAVRLLEQNSRLIVPSGFGNSEDPLFVSVRSGCEKVMEGLLPTIQFVGLCRETVDGLARRYQDTPGAYRLYRRHVLQWAMDVLGMPPHFFDPFQKEPKTVDKCLSDIEKIKGLILTNTGKQFPEDPWVQLREAVRFVSCGWQHPSARAYRKRYGIRNQRPAAVMVQEQAFSALGEGGGAFVVYERSPRTGLQGCYGIGKMGVDGSDLMSGSRRAYSRLAHLSLLNRDLIRRLEALVHEVSDVFRSPVKLECVADGKNGTVYILQAVTGYPMWPVATLRTSVEEYQRGRWSAEQVHEAMTPDVIRGLMMSRFRRPRSQKNTFLIGKAECNGTAEGVLVRDVSWLLEQPRRRRFILVTDTLEISRWEEVFSRVTGIILTSSKLGAHFHPRAFQTEIAVVSKVDPAILEGLEEGEFVFLDASRPDAYLTTSPVKREASPLALAVAGRPITRELGRRSRELIDLWKRYCGIDPKYGERADHPRFIALSLLERDLFTLGTIRDIALAHGWIGEASERDETARKGFKEFIQNLFGEDRESPAKVCTLFVHAEPHEYELLLEIAQALFSEQREQFLIHFAEAAECARAKPGWECGGYMPSRILAAIAESGRPPYAAFLSPESRYYFLRDLYELFYWADYPVSVNTSPEDQEKHQMAADLIDRSPWLQDRAQAGRDLKEFFNKNFQTWLQGWPLAPPELLQWFGRWVGWDVSPTDLADLGSQRRPDTFSSSLLRAHIMDEEDPARLASSILDYLPPVPDLATSVLLLKKLGMARELWDPEKREDIIEIREGGVDCCRQLYARGRDRCIDWVCQTGFGNHKYAVAFFRSLTSVQKVDLMNHMAARYLQQGRQPGYESSLFLISRFFSMNGDDIHIRSLDDETLAFLLQEYCLFVHLRDVPASGVIDRSLNAELFPFIARVKTFENAPEISGAYIPHEETSYLRDTEMRYPNLTPSRFFGILIKRLGIRRLQDFLQGGRLPPAIVQWYEQKLSSL